MNEIEEILKYINQFDYAESSAILERIISEHLRGRVFLNVINKHVEGSCFFIEYNSRLRQALQDPQETVETYIERYGFREMVKYLTDREDKERMIG